MAAAVAGKGARRVFQSTELIVVTTEHNVAEVREYLPEFAARYELPEEVPIQATDWWIVRDSSMRAMVVGDRFIAPRGALWSARGLPPL